MPPELFDQFQDLVYHESALRFSPSRRTKFESQLQRRIAARGMNDYADYLELVRQDRGELDALIQSIVTGETYFFRLPKQFEFLRHHVLPEWEALLPTLIRERGGIGGGKGTRVPLRVWSAGCSTGEEAWTAAMTLRLGLRYPRCWNLEITATDINPRALEHARRGRYPLAGLERIPLEYRRPDLLRTDGGELQVGPEAQALVRFTSYNLNALIRAAEGEPVSMHDPWSERPVQLAQRFDLIFCRNVMIYFDAEAQMNLIRGLHAALRPGGYLFTGDAELLHIFPHPFQTREFRGAVVYRKPETGAQPQPGRPRAL